MDEEKEEDRWGTEVGGYVGDIGKHGEAGREWLLPWKCRIWISRESPKLPDRDESRRQTWMNLHERDVMTYKV